MLGEVAATRVFHEHWLLHPITTDHPRPFFVAKGSELDVALPHRKQARAQSVWTVATPIGGFVESPATPQIQGVDPIRTSLGEQIAAQTAFGLDQIVANPAPATRRKVFRFEPFRHPFIETLIKRLERDGVPGLLAIATQTPPAADAGAAGGHFDTTFAPSHK